MGLLIAKVIISLLFVLALMYGALKLLQRWTKLGRIKISGENDIKISSILYIDEGTKVISLNSLQKEYILGVTKNNIILIDKNEKLNK
jgi:flagellar biogenesis protein FliO